MQICADCHTSLKKKKVLHLALENNLYMGTLPDDLTWIGNGVPKYMASLTQSFTYKNFDLMLFFRGKFDFDILNTQDMFFGSKKWLPNNLLKSALTKHAKLNDDPQYSARPTGHDYESRAVLGFDRLNVGWQSDAGYLEPADDWDLDQTSHSSIQNTLSGDPAVLRHRRI